MLTAHLQKIYMGYIVKKFEKVPGIPKWISLNIARGKDWGRIPKWTSMSWEEGSHVTCD